MMRTIYPAPSPSRPTSSRALVVLLIVSFLLALPEKAYGARLPEWARPIADSAPPLPEGVTEKKPRLLFREVRVTVGSEGTLTSRLRLVRQNLSSRSPKIDVEDFFFQEGARGIRSRAWHMPPVGKTEKTTSAVDVVMGDGFLEDGRARLVEVSGLKPGSIVVFEFEHSESPLMLNFSHLFFDSAETLTDRFEIELPSPGWSVHHAWLRQRGPEPVVEGNLWRWELRDRPAYEPERFGGQAADAAPMLYVGLAPPAEKKGKFHVVPDWVSFGGWYEGVIKGRATATAEVSSAAKSAIQTAPAGFWEKVKGSALFVRNSVRYLSVGIGIGNFQPRPAGEVIGQLYGDCKDKATLLKSMLGVHGIESHLVLVHATIPDTVSEQVPALSAFNHAVLAVPVPQDTTPPASFASAVVDGGDLGRLLFVDTTDPYIPVGSLPLSLMEKRVLVVAGTRSRLLTLPKATPALNQVERRYRVQVNPDRSLTIELRSHLLGNPASEARSAYRSSSEARRKTTESLIRKAFLQAETRSYDVEPETADGAFLETAVFDVPPSTRDQREAFLFIGADNSLPRVSLSKRKRPVNYDHPITIRYESTVSGVPAMARLHAAEGRQGKGWTIRTHAERKGETIEGSWELVLSQSRYEPVDFGDLKALWQAINATGRAVIDLDEEG